MAKFTFIIHEHCTEINIINTTMIFKKVFYIPAYNAQMKFNIYIYSCIMHCV